MESDDPQTHVTLIERVPLPKTCHPERGSPTTESNGSPPGWKSVARERERTIIGYGYGHGHGNGPRIRIRTRKPKQTRARVPLLEPDPRMILLEV